MEERQTAQGKEDFIPMRPPQGNSVLAFKVDTYIIRHEEEINSATSVKVFK